MNTISINGLPIENYICKLIEQNDTNMIEIERGKLAVSALKQLNNHLRYQLDVVKFQSKQAEMKSQNQQISIAIKEKQSHGAAISES